MLMNTVVPGIDVNTGMLVSGTFLSLLEDQPESKSRRDVMMLTPV